MSPPCYVSRHVRARSARPQAPEQLLNPAPVWDRWADDVRPDRSPIATVNALDIHAPAEAIWAQLVRAEAWPDFYENARKVVVHGPSAPDLAEDVVFTWVTFGLPVRTVVEVFEPPHALSWRGQEPYGRAVHTWQITPIEGGCRVTTEEVQAGLVPWLARWYLRPGLLRWHQRWLEGLASRA